MCSDSNPEQPTPQKDNHLLSLPEDIVLNCLARVPRNCNLNLAHVSKTLRTFVSSPELNRLRSLLHKSSLYVCFKEINVNGTWTYRWLTLEKTTIEYRLVPFPCDPYPLMSGSLAVSVGSEIYFLSKLLYYPSADLWILDTRSGKFSQGPSMKDGFGSEAVGVIDGKIYVICRYTVAGFHGKTIHVEVLDPKTKNWKSEGQEKLKPTWYNNISASLERKVYMVEAGGIRVYNPREGEGERVHMISKRLCECNNPRECIRKERLDEAADWVCVVENVLYACYYSSGLMWFDTKLNVWRRVVSRYAEEVCRFGEHAVAEYEGKLAVFEFINHDLVDNTKSVKMFLFSFHRAGEKILGTIEWSGIVATVPSLSKFLHCFGMII